MSDPFDQRRLWIAEHVYERAHLTGEFQLRSGELRSEHLDKCRLASLATVTPSGVSQTHRRPHDLRGRDAESHLREGNPPLRGLKLQTGGGDAEARHVGATN